MSGGENMANKKININISAQNNASRNVDDVSSSLKSMLRGIDNVNRGISNFDGALRSYNNAMSNVNSMYKNALREAGQLVYGFTTDAINAYSDLESQHARTLGAMASDYGKSLSEQQKFISNGEKLKQQAIELSKIGTGGSNRGSLVNPVDISSAQTALIKSGKSADDILGTKAIDVIVNFSKGNDLDMDTAVDFAVTLGKQFGYSMDQWEEMLDKVSHAADTSIIEVEDIVNSMRYAGGIASGLDRPMSEILSMLSIMGNAGLKGSMAGTGVQAFLTRLLASGTVITDDAIEKAPGGAGLAYEEFYERVMDVDNNLADMGTVLNELDAVMADLNDEEQAWFARKVFSMFQMKAAYALTGSDNENLFEETMRDIERNSDGTNEIKYNTMLESQPGRLEAVKNAWESAKTDIGMRMEPMVTATADEILSLIQGNGNYSINTDNINDAIAESKQLIAEAYGDDIAEFIESIADTVFGAGMIGKALLPQVGGIGSAFVKLFNGDVSGAFDELAQSLDKTNTNIDGLPDELQEMAKAVKNVIIALTALAAVNTATNLIQSATTIWGVTGGAAIGGMTRMGGKVGSQSFAQAVANMAGNVGNPNKLYSGGYGIIDSIMESMGANDDSLKALKADMDAKDLIKYESNRKMTDYHLARKKYEGATKSISYHDVIKQQDNALLVGNGSYSSDRMKQFYDDIGFDWKKNGVRNPMDDKNSMEYFKSVNDYVRKFNGSDVGTKDLTEIAKRIADQTGDVAENTQKANSWWKTYKPSSKPSGTVDDPNVLKAVAKRVADENTMKSKQAQEVAKQTKEMKALTETTKEMNRISKITTTDLKDVAKAAKENAENLGKSRPYADAVGDTVSGVKTSVKATNTATTTKKAVDAIDNVATKTVKSTDDIAKTLGSTVDNIGITSKKLSPFADDLAKVGGKADDASKALDLFAVSYDDIIDVVRSANKNKLKENIAELVKAGFDPKEIFDSVVDMKGKGFSADDMMKTFTNISNKMKPKPITFGTTMKNLGKIGIGLGGGLATGLLEDAMINRTIMNTTGGAFTNWNDYIDAILDGTADKIMASRSVIGYTSGGARTFADGTVSAESNSGFGGLGVTGGYYKAINELNSLYSQNYINNDKIIDYTGFNDKVSGIINQKVGAHGLKETAPSVHGFITGLTESIYNMMADSNTLPVGNHAREEQIATIVNGLMDKYTQLQELSYQDPINTVPHQGALIDYIKKEFDMAYNQKYNPGIAAANSLIGSEKLFKQLNVSNQLKVQQPISFNPNVNIDVKVDQTGRVISRTTRIIPDYKGLAEWQSTMTSRMSE